MIPFFEEITEFSRRISGGKVPQLVPYQPSLDAQPRFCFQNVLGRVEFDGGHMVTGWMWHVEDVDGEPAIVIAEHHAVWRTPDGTLIDITPQTTPCDVNGSHLVTLDYQATLLSSDGSKVGRARNNSYFPLKKGRKLLVEIKRLRKLEAEMFRDQSHGGGVLFE